MVAEQKSGVSTFIADQMKSWDMEQLISLIEVNVGKDLQYIRFNGTVVGGLIGVPLMKRVPEKALKKGFGWFVLAMGLVILVRELIGLLV